MRFGATELDAVLDQQLPEGATGLLVGISGGADSSCLLTALAQLRDRCASRGASASRAGALPLRAVHIDHGLQTAAGALRRAAGDLCARLRVPLVELGVSVDSAGESLEAAARAARYGAFSSCLAPGECLLTAHHADDQAETLLLQLLRGAGVKGLSAMPARRRLGVGWHVRPLLEVPRRELEQYALAQAIESCADPMNRDRRFDRAYLREELWPKILARWPGAVRALGRSAAHAADAQQFLDHGAVLALSRLRDGDALSVPALRCLPAHERLNALRRWLTELGIRVPSSARLREGLRQVLTADADHIPAVRWGAHALRRYRQRLYVTAASPPALAAPRDWRRDAHASFELGPGLGALRWVARPGGLDAGRLPDVLSVRRRCGGEMLKPSARSGTKSVAHLCQERGILPWMRDALPMIYAGETLIAVGDLWQDARWLASRGAPGLACGWSDAPQLC